MRQNKHAWYTLKVGSQKGRECLPSLPPDPVVLRSMMMMWCLTLTFRQWSYGTETVVMLAQYKRYDAVYRYTLRCWQEMLLLTGTETVVMLAQYKRSDAVYRYTLCCWQEMLLQKRTLYRSRKKCLMMHVSILSFVTVPLQAATCWNSVCEQTWNNSSNILERGWNMLLCSGEEWLCTQSQSLCFLDVT